MNEKLRSYINAAFANAPKTKQSVELKEEILQNITDKYNDLINEGKSEEAAYNIAIASIGDLSELIGTLNEKAEYPFTKEELIKSKNRSALFITVAVMLYILCVVPCIMFESSVGPVLMFLMIAVATGLLVYNSKTKLPHIKIDDTMVEEFKDFRNKKREKNSIEAAISGLLWAITLALYFLVSFATGAWYITWLMFVISAALQNVLTACFELVRK